MQVDEIIEKKYGLGLKNTEIIKIKNEKVRIINKAASQLMSKINFRIKFFGLYLGKIKRNRKFVFSLFASTLFGKYIRKNIVEINEDELKSWILGKDIEKQINNSFEDFVVIKFKDYYLGSGYYKDGRIKNFFPTSKFKQYLNFFSHK
ncbi:MAG: NIP7 N-terminal domain-related protein [Candidatus Aenigmarchaeota archaeon]|nr:hypothetical protein [Candidatus Aenigmarchaeota archaeon]MDW8149502.1 NIP7 N-terminal domain-related protein [Candidatus Aenigmarchaeota archaeon]